MDDGRYTLAADDYFRLVAKLREVEVLRLEARLALQGPEQAGARMLAELAVKYGFDPVVVSGKLVVLKDDPMGLYYRLTDAVAITK